VRKQWLEEEKGKNRIRSVLEEIPIGPKGVTQVIEEEHMEKSPKSGNKQSGFCKRVSSGQEKCEGVI